MKNIITYSFILFFMGIGLVSCLGDLDTMPLDDNQLVSERYIRQRWLHRCSGKVLCITDSDGAARW